MNHKFFMAVVVVVASAGGCGQGSSHVPKCEVADHAVIEVLKTELRSVQTERDDLKRQVTTVNTVDQFKDKLVNIETGVKALNEQIKKGEEQSKKDKDELIRRKGELDQREALLKEREKRQQEWKNEVSNKLETEIKKIEGEQEKVISEMGAVLETLKKAEDELARLEKEPSTPTNRDAVRRQKVVLVSRQRDFELAMQRAQTTVNAQITRLRQFMPR